MSITYNKLKMFVWSMVLWSDVHRKNVVIYDPDW